MHALRFECVPGCTNCCEVEGWVYITERDLKRMARYLKMPAAEFDRKYVYRTRHRLRLRKPRGSQCHFLTESGCSVHPVKPTQCRLFPFWPELVSDRDVWAATGKSCPGIGTGPLVQIGTAHEIADEMREAYPALY